MMNAIATVLGWIMNAIYVFLAWASNVLTGGRVTVGNIGIAIILFTLIIYLAMIPLTYRQQKFSKLQSKMQPEIKAIQEKYKDKKDQQSQLLMNEEVQGVYAKYGVSMSGSCVQMILQMLILFPLYRVIYNMPKFVPAVKSVFTSLADSILQTKGAEEVLRGLSGAKMFTSDIDKGLTSDTIASILNKCSTADWNELSNWANGNSQLESLINKTHTSVLQMNNFLGLNIADSPQYMFTQAIKNGITAAAIISIIAAIIVPFLAFATQYLSVKLTTSMTQNNNDRPDPNDTASQMQQSMKVMNVTMPLFSAYICFTLPAGMGIYWIASAVVRTITAIIINHRIDKIDIDAMIEANKDKAQKKMEKMRERTSGLSDYQNFRSRNLSGISSNTEDEYEIEKKRAEKLAEAESYYNSGNCRKNSLLYAANLVKEYDKEHDAK
ncbi:YidC/Oxa1 family membrane protein insertase [Butyrivibrio sp. MC2013]|uniref:YidC/Oxa1 family membrane protein insertase n=1 Tax=Butyrivibrio sp. MC2013 TaxID=1280686 RepID=UPI000427D034|nr:YidC/Oxa1 family membrane protein insertase [Butyrivibrio sp. MC2013]